MIVVEQICVPYQPSMMRLSEIMRHVADRQDRIEVPHEIVFGHRWDGRQISLCHTSRVEVHEACAVPWRALLCDV
jgi:hypothetical protein